MGDFSDVVSVVTESYLAPQNISSMTINGLGNNQLRLKFKFGNSFRDEVATITKYRQGELQSYHVTTIKRSGDPRDEDQREERISMILSDQEIGNWTYVCTPSNPSGNGGADTDSDNVT